MIDLDKRQELIKKGMITSVDDFFSRLFEIHCNLQMSSIVNIDKSKSVNKITKKLSKKLMKSIRLLHNSYSTLYYSPNLKPKTIGSINIKDYLTNALKVVKEYRSIFVDQFMIKEVDKICENIVVALFYLDKLK